jgi:hypothetical protein
MHECERFTFLEGDYIEKQKCFFNLFTRYKIQLSHGIYYGLLVKATLHHIGILNATRLMYSNWRSGCAV